MILIHVALNIHFTALVLLFFPSQYFPLQQSSNADRGLAASTDRRDRWPSMSAGLGSFWNGRTLQRSQWQREGPGDQMGLGLSTPGHRGQYAGQASHHGLPDPDPRPAREETMVSDRAGCPDCRRQHHRLWHHPRPV